MSGFAFSVRSIMCVGGGLILFFRASSRGFGSPGEPFLCDVEVRRFKPLRCAILFDLFSRQNAGMEVGVFVGWRSVSRWASILDLLESHFRPPEKMTQPCFIPPLCSSTQGYRPPLPRGTRPPRRTPGIEPATKGNTVANHWATKARR